MRIITVSRQFSSGGRELAKRMADILGFDYYDREIIDEIAKNKSLDSVYVEASLNSTSIKAIPLHFARSFSFVAGSGKTELLIEERRVIEEIAKKGRDFIIVGRNADVILRNYKPFNIFVCASFDAKIKRCIEKAKGDVIPTEREIAKLIKQIDRNRERIHTLVSGEKFGQCDLYHLIVNSTDWQIKELAVSVADFANRFFGRNQ